VLLPRDDLDADREHDDLLLVDRREGVWIVAYLAFPILVTAGAYVALVAGRRAVVSTLAILLLVLCVLSALSIGVFYIPSAVALLVATARMDRSGAGGATSRS
jgi:hypothetical protein